MTSCRRDHSRRREWANSFDVVKAIGKQDDERASSLIRCANRPRSASPARSDPDGANHAQGVSISSSQMARLAAGRGEGADALADDSQPRGVVLLEHQAAPGIRLEARL